MDDKDLEGVGVDCNIMGLDIDCKIYVMMDGDVDLEIGKEKLNGIEKRCVYVDSRCFSDYIFWRNSMIDML